MGIEPTSEAWESTKLFVGRSAAFMRPRRRRGSSERHGQDGSFGALQPPATMGAGRRNSKRPFYFQLQVNLQQFDETLVVSN
jgi:hypothetical protein